MEKCVSEHDSYWATNEFNETVISEYRLTLSSSGAMFEANETSPDDLAANRSYFLDEPASPYAEDMQRLKYYSYGIVLPTVCILGVVGNAFNLVVLTRPTMKGPAYVYMRGKRARLLYLRICSSSVQLVLELISIQLP